MGVGLIRILLAFSVVGVHAGFFYGFNIVNGVVAVRAFFIISGFYMALILQSNKYKKYSTFLKSRFLRIYPIYWIMLALIVGLGIIAHLTRGTWGELQAYADNGSHLNPISFILLVAGNITIFGRDVLSALGINPTSGFFTFTSNLQYTVPAKPFLLIPQAWTIVLEVLFYLIAPVLTKRKTGTLVALVGMGVALRLIMQMQFGMTDFVWRYSFFPTELPLFILGILSYRIYAKLKSAALIPKRLIAGLTALLFIVIFLYNFLPIDATYKEVGLYLCFTGLLPFAFTFSNNNRYDRWIGDLSYPIYISHLFVMSLIYPTLFNLTIHDSNWIGITVFVCTTLFSILLIKFVQNPIDRRRAKLSK